jgi:phenylacetate-CoA ligase
MTARDLLSIANKLRLLALTRLRLRLGPEALRRVQLRRLQRVLEQAYARVPLYREKLEKAQLQPRDLVALGDLARFPITEKDEIRDVFPHGCTVAGSDLARCRIQQTSGSSGQCMEIALDRASDDERTLYTQRVYGMQGFTWHRRMAYLFPYALPLQRNLGLYRNRHFKSTLPPRVILAGLRAWRPHLLAATPSDLFELCDGLDPAEDLTSLGLLALCVHSEPMSADERSYLARRFGCRVATNYYCNEVWAIAAECRHGALHQFSDHVVLEIVDDAGRPVAPGEVGHVLVTSLSNHVQPFIRYRLGDLAAWDPSPLPCPCGLALPRLLALEGRDDDVLVRPDGRAIHPSKVTVAVKSPCFAHPGAQIFRDYRIVQLDAERVRVQIVPGRDRAHLQACIEAAGKNLQRLLGAPFQVNVEVVPVLERGPGGKRKIVERRGERS